MNCDKVAYDSRPATTLGGGPAMRSPERPPTPPLGVVLDETSKVLQECRSRATTIMVALGCADEEKRPANNMSNIPNMAADTLSASHELLGLLGRIGASLGCM